MNKLQSILDKYFKDCPHIPAQLRKECVKALHTEIEKNVIGEDEPAPMTTQKIINGQTVYDEFDDMLRPGRNDLRAQQRKALNKLMGEK